jgi:hypothetical protein
MLGEAKSANVALAAFTDGGTAVSAAAAADEASATIMHAPTKSETGELLLDVGRAVPNVDMSRPFVVGSSVVGIGQSIRLLRGQYRIALLGAH